MKKIAILSIVLLLFASFSTVNYFSELVKEKLEKYAIEDTPEKIYIHTDKPYYALGDDIWFTGYLVNGITHTTNPKSFIFYVELINEKDSIVAKKRLFNADVTVPGDFKIDKNWNAGTYTLRAYSNYMRNENSSYFFKKKLKIISSQNRDTIISISNSSEKNGGNFQLIKPDLNFYPEGGDLVENIRSEVGVKIKNELFHDIKIDGKITNQNNQVITQFTVSKFGLSKFSFTPQPNNVYKASISFSGSEYTYPLPKALPNGHSLNIVNKGSHLYITAKSSSISGLNQTYLVGQQRGIMIVEKFETTNTNQYLLKLVTDKLNDGVAHFTLFDASGNPVCERLVFIENSNNQVSVEIIKNKEYLKTREELKLSLNVKDFEGNLLPSHLSMSIRDVNAFPEEKHLSNIKSWLLLNSDLRGEIKNPGYFFNEKSIAKRRYLLDLVMLTHGWRRFTWKDLLYKEKTKEFAIEKGINISGRTHQLKSPYAIVPSVSRLTFLKQPMEQEPRQVSELGAFNFGPYVFFDSIPILIESRLTNDFMSENINNKKLSIMLDRAPDSPLVYKDSNTAIDKSTNEAFLKITKYMAKVKSEYENQRQLLDEVIIKAKKKQEESERLRQIRARTEYGEPTNRLDLQNGPPMRGVSTAFDLIQRLPGVIALGGQVTIRGNAPQIMIDNLRVDPNYLTSVPSDDISFIDLLTGASASLYPNLSGGISGGVILLYTKQGYTNRKTSKPGKLNFTAKGFYTAREFYAPDHLNGIEEQMKGDIRTTLHWEPEIKTKADSASEVSFFTSDSKSEYLIEIEGITKTGIPIYHTAKFLVE